MELIYYCPNCLQQINKPHEAQNPKGTYLESTSCGIRIIGSSFKGWITNKTIAEGKKIEYKQIYKGDKSKKALYVIEE